jgi:hypothetical protein
MPVDALVSIREDIASGTFGIDVDMRHAMLARVDDLAAAIEAAERALAKVPHPAVGEAAAKLAYLFYASGRGWRRYLSESAAASKAGEQVRIAMQTCADPVIALLAQELAAIPRGPVIKRSATVYALPCAVCGADAVTLTRTQVSPAVPEQLVMSSLSPVTVFRPVTGPRMSDLVTLLEHGDAAAVVRHMRATHPGGCDAYCATCERLYCKAHFAIEAQWSGSWHEATYVTCPLGHEAEIE